MKWTLPRLAVAASLSFGFTSVAQAVPIYFDFSGTVSSGGIGAPIGAAASGGIRLESDRLLSAGAPTGGVQYSFLDWQPVGLSEPLAFLNIGDTRYSIDGGENEYSLINFADGCQPLCNLGWVENFNLGAHSGMNVAAGYTGATQSTSITFYSLYQTPLPDYPYWQGFDMFNGADMRPLDVLSLPLGRTDVSFLNTQYDCVDGSCTQVGATYLQVALDSVSRGTGPAASVPEPGTLGLLAFGLFGAFAARRKYRTDPSTRE
jgi:hypothetical protein